MDRPLQLFLVLGISLAIVTVDGLKNAASLLGDLEFRKAPTFNQMPVFSANAKEDKDNLKASATSNFDSFLYGNPHFIGSPGPHASSIRLNSDISSDFHNIGGGLGFHGIGSGLQDISGGSGLQANSGIDQASDSGIPADSRTPGSQSADTPQSFIPSPKNPVGAKVTHVPFGSNPLGSVLLQPQPQPRSQSQASGYGNIKQSYGSQSQGNIYEGLLGAESFNPKFGYGEPLMAFGGGGNVNANAPGSNTQTNMQQNRWIPVISSKNNAIYQGSFGGNNNHIRSSYGAEGLFGRNSYGGSEQLIGAGSNPPASGSAWLHSFQGKGFGWGWNAKGETGSSQTMFMSGYPSKQSHAVLSGDHHASSSNIHSTTSPKNIAGEGYRVTVVDEVMRTKDEDHQIARKRRASSAKSSSK